MSRLMYIWGQPGSGKSTLVRELVFGHVAFPAREDGLDIIDYSVVGVVEIGKEREDFRGTDALGMTVINTAVKALPGLAMSGDVLAEGDRLAVDRFFRAAIDAGFILELVYLNTPDALAAERRRARGSAQSEAWVKGRITKAAKLAERWDPLVLDGSRTPEELAHDLMGGTYVGARFA